MLKELILMFGITFIALYFYTEAPPQVVQHSFKQKFCEAKDIKWRQDDNDHWHATFTYKEAKLSAAFTEDGQWLKTDEAIPASWFPPTVSVAIAKDFTGWKITEADKTESAKYGLLYSVNIKSGPVNKEVAFNEYGSLVNECTASMP